MASQWTEEEKRLLKIACEADLLFFMRYFFQVRDGSKMIISWHHVLLCRFLMDVHAMKIPRAIINIPPGYTKTEAAVIAFSAWSLAKNPRCKFIQSSYSDNLAMTSSSYTKEIITSPEFQELWPTELRADTNSKKIWWNKQGGGVYAPASGGQVTGFRAGRTDGEDKSKFTGAFIMDDPIKPDDAFAEALRLKINNRFTNTYKSRLMYDEIPFIVIMQRIHDSDPTGFLLKGGTGEKWHHLNLPVTIDEHQDTLPYPEEYKFGIPYPYEHVPGPLWPWKHNAKAIELLKADEHTYNTQYMQAPSPPGGGVFKDDWWDYYDEIPKLRLIVIYMDGATKKEETNDYNVFNCVGLTTDGRLCILDVFRKKMETPEMLEAALAFHNKHKHHHGANRTGARVWKIEDKSSGTFLLQHFRKLKIPVADIQRNTDKTQRALLCAPEYKANGGILLPRGETPLTDARWVHDFKIEHSRFTMNDTHDYDDQIDTTLDAVEDLLLKKAFGIYDNLQ